MDCIALIAPKGIAGTGTAPDRVMARVALCAFCIGVPALAYGAIPAPATLPVDAAPTHDGFIGVKAPADYYVEDVDVDSNGFLYSADSSNDRIVKFAPDLSIVLEIAYPEFKGPRYLSVSPDGRIFVSDTTGGIVYVFAADGSYLDECPGADRRSFGCKPLPRSA